MAVYHAVANQVDKLAAGAAELYCGFSACIDIQIQITEQDGNTLRAACSAESDSIRDLANRITGRLRQGRGGELDSDEEGVRWLSEHFRGTPVLGGTGAHIARAYATVGAPAVLELRDHSAQQLAVVPDSITIAAPNGLAKPVREASPVGQVPQDPIPVLEVTAGTKLWEGLTIKRSTRLIVIVRGRTMDVTPDAVSYAQLSKPDGVIVSGFQTMKPSAWPEVSERLGLILAHRPNFAHHEVAEYQSLEFFDRVVSDLAQTTNSLGMSMSELNILAPGNQSAAERALELAKRLDLNRVCVHADWGAFTVTRNDPQQESLALLTGCLFASNRANSGPGGDLTAVPNDSAIFDRSAVAKFGSITDPEYAFVSVVAPYYQKPITTLGLGDTFVAGTSLVLNN